MIFSLRSGLVFTALALLLFFSPAAAQAAALDVAAANSHMDRAEANLQLVDGTIGQRTSPPKGSAGKLARMRLDQAKADLDPAASQLAGVPDGPELAEARARLAADLALYKKLDGILTGTPPQPKPQPKPDPGPAPQPDPGPSPDPAPQPQPEVAPPAKKTVKLGYPHADNFKNSLSTLRRVEGGVTELAQIIDRMRATADQLAVNHRQTAGTLTNLTETRRQAGFVEAGLAKIPANGEGVDEAGQRLVTARAKLDELEAYLKPLDAQLQELVDPARYPEFQADLKQLNELAAAYRNPDYLFRDVRTLAAETHAQADAAKAECQRIAKTYLRLMEQETEQGKRIEAAGNNFLNRQQTFLDAAEQQRVSLPQSIREDLAEADRLAAEAVTNQKPLWFTGGIPQRMGWAEDKLGLLQALDPKAAVAVTGEVGEMKASLSERAESLRELIIRENQLPDDNYAGPDREATLAVAQKAWKIQQADYELLAVRIPNESWSRETKWTYSSGTWYFSDISSLQVRLIVADPSDPSLAIDRPINVRMDHQKGDSMYGVPLRSIDEKLQPHEYYLREKVR